MQSEEYLKSDYSCQIYSAAMKTTEKTTQAILSLSGTLSNKQEHLLSVANILIKIKKSTQLTVAVAALLLIGNTKTMAQCTTPGWPVNVHGTAVGPTTANISWSAGSPVGSPTVNYYWVVGTWSNVPYGSGTSQSYTTGFASSIGGLTANTTYYLRVYANTSCDNTNSLDEN